jgi:DNA-binding transcriptional MerR regulator
VYIAQGQIGMKMKQVADRLGKHDNTIRNYAKQFAEFLSPAPAKGETRVFTDDDVRVLSFISRLSDSGMSIEEIRAALRRKFEEGTPFPPVLPALTPTEERGVITVQEMEMRLALKDNEINELRGRLEELRERAQSERETYLDQIRKLSEDIGQLRAELRTRSG